MKKYKTHYFEPRKSNNSVCGVKPSDENWCRNDYCTGWKKNVTCENCLKILKKKLK